MNALMDQMQKDHSDLYRNTLLINYQYNTILFKEMTDLKFYFLELNIDIVAIQWI